MVSNDITVVYVNTSKHMNTQETFSTLKLKSTLLKIHHKGIVYLP